MNEQEVNLIVKLINEQKTHLKHNKDLENQMEKIIQLLEENTNMPRLYGKMNLEVALVKKNMMKVIIGLFRDEFKRIRSELEDDDKEGSVAASKLIELLSDEKTVEAFSLSGKAEVNKFLSTWNESEYNCEVNYDMKCLGCIDCVSGV